MAGSLRYAAVVAVISLTTACTGVPATSSMSARASTTVREQIAKDGGMPWNRTRPVRWVDFQGTPPQSGPEGALTAYSLLYGVSCTGTTFDFEVSAVFLPARSWVRALVLADPDESRRTLRHEQTHFDVTEVHARRLRRVLSEIYDPCRTGRAAVPTEADKVIDGEAAAQQRYDDETRHGLDATRQRAWDQDVAGWLAELDSYGGK